MKILYLKLQKLEQLEDITNKAEAAYEAEPENAECEKVFDDAYKNEFAAFVDVAKYIEAMTSGKIDFLTAKKMVQTKRAELINILA